ncbi:MAG: EVE domain-containing protein [Gammaproteobacteria bacterium]|nr:EVE domain-containing protein [Gammaproteobacteria bacterium]
MNYWLMKSEPDVFSLADLRKAPAMTAHWDGVRNYQARNYIRDRMRHGDLAYFYHSSCRPPGIAGIIEIVSAPYADHTAFDSKNPHFDPAGTADNPRWYMVDVRFRQAFDTLITLDTLRQHPPLLPLPLLQRGNRLSVMPVLPEQWKLIETLAR